MKKNLSGFTLIELMVVVAIIGLLVSIVTVSIRSSREKGADTGVKRGLSELQKQAELYYYEHDNSYSGLCQDSKVISQLTVTAKNSGITTIAGNGEYGAGEQATCHDSVRDWAAEVPTAESTSASPVMWCVDSRGKSQKVIGVVLDVNAVVCPDSQ